VIEGGFSLTVDVTVPSGSVVVSRVVESFGGKVVVVSVPVEVVPVGWVVVVCVPVVVVVVVPVEVVVPVVVVSVVVVVVVPVVVVSVVVVVDVEPVQWSSLTPPLLPCSSQSPPWSGCGSSLHGFPVFP
jgi:hypothetical protein